jgi:hypothetical protein
MMMRRRRRRSDTSSFFSLTWMPVSGITVEAAQSSSLQGPREADSGLLENFLTGSDTMGM